MIHNLFSIKIWVLAWHNGQLLPKLNENLKAFRLVVLELQRFSICHFDLKTVYVMVHKCVHWPIIPFSHTYINFTNLSINQLWFQLSIESIYQSYTIFKMLTCKLGVSTSINDSDWIPDGAPVIKHSVRDNHGEFRRHIVSVHRISRHSQRSLRTYVNRADDSPAENWFWKKVLFTIAFGVTISSAGVKRFSWLNMCFFFK